MRVGIIGTGLIGASVGLAAKRRGWDILGWDRDAEAASRAQALGAIDRVAAVDELYATCDVVVIAVPPRATLDEIARLRTSSLRDDLLVIDVASVKTPVVRAAGAIAAFVATHPMAGSERSGPGAARADLFDGRTWCYVPASDARRTAQVRSFVEALGATAVAVDPERHDRIVALTSHLPQYLAYLFSESIDERSKEEGDLVAALCGPVARELLRLGHSSHAMWDDVFALNAAALDAELVRLGKALDDRLSG